MCGYRSSMDILFSLLLILFGLVMTFVMPLGLRGWPERSAQIELGIRCLLVSALIAAPVPWVAHHAKGIVTFSVFVAFVAASLLWTFLWMHKRAEIFDWTNHTIYVVRTLMGKADLEPQRNMEEADERAARMARRLHKLVTRKKG